MVRRETAKMKIMKLLEEKPLGAKEIAKGAHINYNTARRCLGELMKAKKVKKAEKHKYAIVRV